jgi:DegV family protein with EDD domain
VRAVGIATDSSSDLSPELSARLDVPVTPIVVRVGGRDIEVWPPMDRDAYFRAIAQEPLSGTAAVNTQRWLEAYQALADHVDRIVVVALGSRFSTTCQSARVAASLFPERPVDVFDTDTVFAGLAALTVGAAEMALAGADAAAVMDWLAWAKPRTGTYMVTPSLGMLRRIGRVAESDDSSAAYAVVTVQDGRFAPVGAAPSYAEALDRVLTMAETNYRLSTSPLVVVDHARAADQATEAAQALAAHLHPARLVRIDDGPIMPVLADGFGAVAIGVAPPPPGASAADGT